LLDAAHPDMAASMEALFDGNDWPHDWRNGVYDYHHYHSTAHEALGIAEGAARLMLGGEGGHELDVHKGDVLVLPAGVGHCCIEASADFLAVGAYPRGQEWDLLRKPATPEVKAAIAAVPLPTSDPATGVDGDLIRLWRR
jgi:uncharacterized protein YjlB